jgi:hypothetical protein
MFIRVYRLEIQSVMLDIFNPALRTVVALLTFSLVQLPPPLPYVKVRYMQTVFGCEGVGGIESCWRPYSEQIQKLQNSYTTTPNKNLGGEGASDR